MVRTVLIIMGVMVSSMSIIVVLTMIIVTIEMFWMVEIVSLDIMVFNSKMILSLNDMPQIIVIMLKISHQVLSMVCLDIMRVIMVGLLDNYVMMP
jgi:hypothetical protein